MGDAQLGIPALRQFTAQLELHPFAGCALTLMIGLLQRVDVFRIFIQYAQIILSNAERRQRNVETLIQQRGLDAHLFVDPFDRRQIVAAAVEIVLVLEDVGVAGIGRDLIGQLIHRPQERSHFVRRGGGGVFKAVEAGTEHQIQTVGDRKVSAAVEADLPRTVIHLRHFV
ncbi:hypothetical protein D3C71_1687810 [compost metagenome]